MQALFWLLYMSRFIYFAQYWDSAIIPDKETEAWKGHTVSKWQGQDPTWKPHSDYPCDVTLFHLQSVGERVCVPRGNVGRLSWAASQWKKAAAGHAMELRHLGASAAWAEDPFAILVPGPSPTLLHPHLTRRDWDGLLSVFPELNKSEHMQHSEAWAVNISLANHGNAW